MSEDFPYRFIRAQVVAKQRISTSFIRVWLAGDKLADFATPGQIYDQRIKLIFPGANGLPDLAGSGMEWYQHWLQLKEDSRGVMRTYSIRALEGQGGSTKLVVDFVRHLDQGASGPASRWAHESDVGDQVLVIGPRRGFLDGGIEFRPAVADRVLLVGDETALPAIARILEDAPADMYGDAIIEVPHEDDRLRFDHPAGVHIHWCVRDGAEHGTMLIESVLGFFGDAQHVPIEEPDSDELVWLTDRYGQSESVVAGRDLDERALYAWIAGESAVVTTLRRHLVREVGVARAQVTFMGYWRRGVAMRG